MFLASLEAALESRQYTPEDAAALTLARAYARALDDGESLEKLGSRYLSSLAALGLTPKARAELARAVPQKEVDDDGGNPLAKLRSIRLAG